MAFIKAYLCFLVSVSAKKKKNAEATEFFEVLKNNFPKIRKYIFLFKKEKACFS